MKPGAKWIPALFVGVMWTVVSVVMWPVVARQRRLESVAAITQGAIIKIDPVDHDFATYRYTVGGREYTGTGLPGKGRSGESVPVYYSPEDPALSSLSDPRGSFRSRVGGLALIYAFFLVGGIIMARRASR